MFELPAVRSPEKSGLVIPVGSRDPPGVPRPRRAEGQTQLLHVLSDMMRGKVHDRHSIAKRCGIQPRAADRRLRLLVEQIDGVKEVPGTTPKQIRFEGDAPRFPAVVAACVASSLGRMFAGSAHEQNM